MSVTHPKGFLASGVAAGLKSKGGKDLALVQNLGPSFAAAVVFTSNRAKANPILWSQQVISDGIASAIILNSGGANCYTGSFGFQTTHLTAESVAEGLGYEGERPHSGPIADELAPWVGTCPAGHVHYRYKRPVRALACGQCSRRFDAANTIQWAQRIVTPAARRRAAS